MTTTKHKKHKKKWKNEKQPYIATKLYQKLPEKAAKQIYWIEPTAW
jgi:hypothetical protein